MTITKISSPVTSLSLPPNPTLALVASLASVALDAAARHQPFAAEPVLELARRLGQRLDAAPQADSGPTRAIDPGTTGLLSAALAPEMDRHTVQSIASEAEKLVAGLQTPLETQDTATLLRLRDFAVRLSAAADQGSLETISFPHTWVDLDS